MVPGGGNAMKLLSSWAMVTAAVLVLAARLAAHAQPPAGELPRIGVLMFMVMTTVAQEEFRQGLRDHGYVEGKNIVVEWRSAEGRTDRVDALAAELVRLKVSVIVAEFTPAVQAAKNATTDDPDRYGVGGGSGRNRARRESLTPRRQRNRLHESCLRVVRQAAGAPSGNHSGTQASWFVDARGGSPG